MNFFERLLDFIGGSSVILSILVFPAAILDPVLSGFIAWAAITLGGLANVGLKDRKFYSIFSILISLISVFFLGLYSADGVQQRITSVISSVLLIMAIPMMVAILFLLIGILRRNR